MPSHKGENSVRVQLAVRFSLQPAVEHVASLKQIHSVQAPTPIGIPRHNKTARVVIAKVAEGVFFMAFLHAILICLMPFPFCCAVSFGAPLLIYIFRVCRANVAISRTYCNQVNFNALSKSSNCYFSRSSLAACDARDVVSFAR